MIHVYRKRIYCIIDLILRHLEGIVKVRHILRHVLLGLKLLLQVLFYFIREVVSLRSLSQRMLVVYEELILQYISHLY